MQGRLMHLNTFMNSEPTQWGETGDGGRFSPEGEPSTFTSTIVDTDKPKATKFAARILTGFAEGMNFEDLTKIVTRTVDIDHVITIQRGIFVLQRKETTTEDGAQILILNSSRLNRLKFKMWIAAFAEKICIALKREEVIVELQRYGKPVCVFGVVPDKILDEKELDQAIDHARDLLSQR